MEKKVVGSFDGIDGDCRTQECREGQGRPKRRIEKEWIKSVLDEARSKDYNHLVSTLLDNMEDE